MSQWPKLARAIELRDELVRWSDSSYRGLDYQTRHNLQVQSDPVAWVEYRLDPDSVPDVERAGLILGDMIHNLRAALDHQVWSVTPAELRRGRTALQVQFPILSTEAKWKEWKRRWGAHYAAKVIEVIESAQPFTIPAGMLSAMASLQALSNYDKHRALNLAAQVALEGNEISLSPRPAGVQTFMHSGPLTADTVLARAEWKRAEDAGYEIELAPVFKFAQQVQVPDLETGQGGDWHVLGDLVNWIVPETISLVGALYSASLEESAQAPNQ